MLMTIATESSRVRLDRDMDLLPLRYYDTTIGQFTSRDTFDGDIDEPQTLQKYAYARSDPVDRIDPSGHEDLISTLTALGVQGLFNGIRLGAIGAVSGAGLGAIDAALGGQDIVQGAIGGAKWGAGLGFSVGLLGPFATTFLAPATISAVLNMGAGASLALGAYGGASSFADGNYLQGIYRIGLGTLGYYSFRSAATAPLKPVNIGGEGEVPNVINLQPRSALDAGFGRATDGESLAGMIREGNQFLIYNPDTGVLPFGTGTVPKVITNSVPIDTPPGGFFSSIKSSEIIRVLKPGGQWVRDGEVFYTKPG
jgi:RHS repeat-associated protein